MIEFPAHAEIRANGSVVHANLRGIKNKPGTINPVDITAGCILMQGVNNKIDVTFAESKSAFTLTIYLVEKLTVARLVEKIRKRGFIAKEATLNKSISLFCGANGSESSGAGCGYCPWSRDVDSQGPDIHDSDSFTL